MEEINAQKGSGIIYINLEGRTYAITENRWSDFVQAYRRGEAKKFLEENRVEKTLHSLRKLWKELGREIKE